MPCDLSLALQACDYYVHGKQARSPILKVHKGVRATKWLERVYVDLSGPHAVLSCFGFHYIMNFIDDYSRYNWTHLLKAKSNAFGAFCTWLMATKMQSHERLCYVLTDNSKLRSADMARWCADCRITHQFTTPHTSTQNGQVKRLHLLRIRTRFLFFHYIPSYSITCRTPRLILLTNCLLIHDVRAD